MDKNSTLEFQTTTINLSILDRSDLLGLLSHRTQLLIVAANSLTGDEKYKHSLKLEVEKIHDEINRRTA